MVRTSHIFLPNSNAKLKSLTRTFNGGGYGAVLLDGGKGGQSSYHSIDNYLETTKQTTNHNVSGNGLADRISAKLSKLNIAPPIKKPKVKNITLSL